MYSLPLKDHGLHITQLEMLNTVIAIKVWSTTWANQRISIYCDNLAVVEVLQSGKTKDSYLATCARNVWMLASIFNIHIDFFHISGKNNEVADLLSRWNGTINAQQKLVKHVPNYQWIHTHPDLTCLNFYI